MKRVELSEEIPFCFPFVAMLRGVEHDYKRIDTPVIVQGYAGMEKHYFYITMLYVEMA